MQFVKTLLIVAVLAVVTYGVYAALTGKSDTAPPPGAPPIEQANGAPQIELPNFDQQPPSGIPGVGGLPGAAPAAAAPLAPPSTLGEAPRYATPPAGADPNGAAPPFDTPGVGPGQAPPAAAVPVAPPVAPLDPPAGLAPPPAGLAPAATELPPAAPGLAPPATGIPPAAALDPTAPPGSAPPPAAPAANYQTDCVTAHGLLQQRQLDQALVLMSRWYNDATLSEQDQTALLGLLNQLAGTVIYSREHWLADAYEVQPGDTLDRIAGRYRVPPQLLAKINAVADPNRLQPGEKLKVVNGPFDAHVDMRNRCLTLWLQGRFAGRFPIAVGAEHAAKDGEYQVQAKTPNPTYYPAGGRVVPAGDPGNPLGQYWIDLGQQIAIHGTNDPESLKRDDQRGCVRMHPRDIEDVYDMVTTESRVTIKR